MKVAINSFCLRNMILYVDFSRLTITSLGLFQSWNSRHVSRNYYILEGDRGYPGFKGTQENKGGSGDGAGWESHVRAGEVM